MTERAGRLAIIEDGKVRRLQMPTDLIWASGETGLMGLAIDPDFAGNGRFYTCNGGNPQGTPDVRIMVWKLNAAATRASYQRTLLSGFPATSGRHGGCRLLILDDGALLVGTGDAATGTNPEDKTLPRRQDPDARPHLRRPVAGQPVRRTPPTSASGTSTPTATATSRASPSGRTAPCGRPSTAPTATTR